MIGKWVLMGAFLLSSAGCSHRAPFISSASLTSLPLGDRCLRHTDDGTCTKYLVSILELVARPEKYHEKPITVVGFVTFEFEGNVLCPTDRRHSSSDCLWVDVEGLKDPGFRRSYVVVDATFDGELRGHFWCCAGSLTKITRLERSK